MEPVSALLQQVAYSQRLTILGSNDQGGAPVHVRYINGYASVKEEANDTDVTVDAPPVNGTWTVFIATVLVNGNPTVDEELHDIQVACECRPVDKGVSFAVKLP